MAMVRGKAMVKNGQSARFGRRGGDDAQDRSGDASCGGDAVQPGRLKWRVLVIRNGVNQVFPGE
jgi:hypothetical protein